MYVDYQVALKLLGFYIVSCELYCKHFKIKVISERISFFRGLKKTKFL